MKKTILFSAITLALAAGAALAGCNGCPGNKKEPAKTAAAAQAKMNCGDCPGRRKAAETKTPGKKCGGCPGAEKGGKMCGGMTCPENIKGARTVSENIANGVEVTTTAQDKETVAQIQELALVHYAPKAEKCKGCPTTVPGAETRFVNIGNGIKVTITGKTPEIVKRIQEASAKEHEGARSAEPRGPGKARAAYLAKTRAAAGNKYSCAMKCVEADKHGPCPKCGMPMEEKK